MLKNRKFLAAVLCVLVATSVALAACQPKDPSSGPCTAHSDADKDGKCDNCGIQVGLQAPSTETVQSVDVTFVVVDNYSEFMAGAKINIKNSDGSVDLTGEVNAEGQYALKLDCGAYTVTLENLPEFHLAGVYNVNVEVGMEPVTLNVVDNTPNGQIERPFVLSNKPEIRHFSANEKLYFSLRGGEGRSVVVENATAEVVYNDQTYTANEEGKVVVRIDSGSPKDQIIISVTNVSELGQEITLRVESDPGTLENPISVQIGQTIVSEIIKDGTKYYQWIATADGSLTVTSASAVNSISLVNCGPENTEKVEGTVMAGPSEGASSVTLENVKAGDVIRIQVAVTAEAAGSVNEVDFTLAFQEN